MLEYIADMSPQNSKQGQTMLETIVVLGMSLGIIVSLGFFIYIFRGHGFRIMDIISGFSFP